MEDPEEEHGFRPPLATDFRPVPKFVLQMVAVFVRPTNV